MNKTLKVGDIFAQPGETKWGPATWVELRDGTRVHLPVILINGKEDGPNVVLNAANHPIELVGYGAIQILTRRIDPSKLKGSIIAFPISNPLGMQFGEYTSPHDLVNMFVAYPGTKHGTITSRLANFIWENAAKNADVVIDLHENPKPCLQFTIVVHTGDDKVDMRTLELAEAVGLTVINEGGKGQSSYPLAGTRASDLAYHQVCLANRIPSFCAEFESGTDLTFREEDPSMRVAVKGIMNVLRKLEMIPGKIEPQTGIKVLKGDFESYGMTIADRGGVVNALVDVGVRLKKGTAIATILSPYGEVLETHEMPVDGYVWAWNMTIPPNFNWSVQSGDAVAYIFREK